jgi:hypothetical protein
MTFDLTPTKAQLDLAERPHDFAPMFRHATAQPQTREAIEGGRHSGSATLGDADRRRPSADIAGVLDGRHRYPI